MRIGIVGPSDIYTWKGLTNISDELLDRILDSIVESMIELKHEMIIVPAKRSMSYRIGSRYKDKNGKKLLGVIPLDDTEFGIESLDEFFCDEVINCVTWRNQPEKFCEESDIILVLGFSPGTLIEMMQTKWFGKIKVLVIEELITSRLPVESADKIDIRYIRYDELEHHMLEKKNDK